MILYCTIWKLCNFEPMKIYLALALQRNKILWTGPICVVVSTVTEDLKYRSQLLSLQDNIFS